jgi:hypothetical protein
MPVPNSKYNSQSRLQSPGPQELNPGQTRQVTLLQYRIMPLTVEQDVLEFDTSYDLNSPHPLEQDQPHFATSSMTADWQQVPQAQFYSEAQVTWDGIMRTPAQFSDIQDTFQGLQPSLVSSQFEGSQDARGEQYPSVFPELLDPSLNSFMWMQPDI